MKTKFYLAAAALLMASTAAHAGNGISFQIEGQKIHIEAPKNCNSLSCISISNNGSAVNLKNINLKGKKSDDDDNVASSAPTPPPAPVAVQPPAPPAPPPAPVASYVPPAPPAPVADATRERLSALPAASAPVAPPAPPLPAAAPVAPAQVANNATAQTAPVAAPPANSPLGLWSTEDNKGNVRIEECGANLCGYAEKTNERILINMKPTQNNKWSGRIHDPDGGSNYDSTIALKGPNLLKVQGCAFGGMFCGGQTWKRIS